MIKQVRNLNLTENLFGDFWAAFNPFPCKMSLSNRAITLATSVEMIFSKIILVKINIIMGKNWNIIEYVMTSGMSP